MNDRQSHRGPDQSGLHVEPGLGLGHRRLSIIDLSGGRQPLYNEDGTVVVVFNGEIYNFMQLATELQRAGHRFETHCDTEVIVHAWEQWGVDCVHRFRGMFAFALWDRNQGVLFVARDRLGIKPLYYADLADGTFVFASELKALRLYPGVAQEVDRCAVEEFFAFGYVPEPRTIFRGVRKLPAGHFLVRSPGRQKDEPIQYWDIPFGEHLDGDESGLGEELLSRLEESVRIRMIADVPLGAFLSGGVDSSAVVAMMARASGAASASAPTNTCSISFGEAQFDESRYANDVAQRYGTHHRCDQVDRNDLDLIDLLAGVFDEPFADSSALPTYRVCELARRQVTVALSGDGGDETMAGYRRYQWHLAENRLRSLFPRTLRRAVFGPLGGVYPVLASAPRPFRAKATFKALGRDEVEGYFSIISVVDADMRRGLFSSAYQKELQGYSATQVLNRHAENSPTDHPLSLIQYLDMKTYLVDDILTKVDRTSMAHGLEVRVPFLDHEFVAWTSRLPPTMNLRGRQGKYLLKKSLEPLLPRDLLYRPKMGFAVPLGEWFRGPLRNRTRSALLGARLLDTGLFDRGYIVEMIDTHERGHRDLSAALWSLLMFDAFLAEGSSKPGNERCTL
jgi:asparagine synthase (glutamine-hydrolysing)